MKVEILQNAPLGAFCNTFGLHSAISGIENQFSVFFRVAVLHRFTVILNEQVQEVLVIIGYA